MTAKQASAYREDFDRPWLGLKGYAASEDESNLEMLRHAGLLDWNVHTREIVTDAKTDTKDFEVLRTDPFDGALHRLGIAGERYRVVQNEALASMADGITSGDITTDAAGSWNNGRNVFMSFRLGKSLTLDPTGQADKIEHFLNIMSGHDGSCSITAFVGSMRIRCQNMLTGAKSSALSIVRFRHTESAEGRLLSARTALGIAFTQSEVFAQDMETLVQREITDAKFWDMVRTIYPAPAENVKGAQTKHEHKMEDIASLWHGPTLSNLEPTAYRAYNALNEHLMWGSGIRKGNPEPALVRASGFDELTNRRNASLYNAVLTLSE